MFLQIRIVVLIVYNLCLQYGHLGYLGFGMISNSILTNAICVNICN
jgi:hypothetical protein